MDFTNVVIASSPPTLSQLQCHALVGQCCKSSTVFFWLNNMFPASVKSRLMWLYHAISILAACENIVTVVGTEVHGYTCHINLLLIQTSQMQNFSYYTWRHIIADHVSVLPPQPEILK